MSTITPRSIEQLTPQERLSLNAALWDSLAEGDLPLSRSHADELVRRLARLDSDKSQSVEWSDLRAEIAARAS